ncbi:hypothetical protein N7466_005585 [Penicillium verhagenii]|uniref:uncharacterized protein n=1 Tax=Penicillium verhagenii TaxID=1562060 RepID=UPI002544DC34|nr:uncharacterized protein N7466_005585 [Penicillium verhagenii]KAJ5930092.1 hypothetical protein N7466_005585 [Penicillium verhagenii]
MYLRQPIHGFHQLQAIADFPLDQWTIDTLTLTVILTGLLYLSGSPKRMMLLYGYSLAPVVRKLALDSLHPNLV